MNDKILLVDDDENLLKIYAQAFPDNLHVTTATGGEDALKMVTAEGPFAVVISDMQMPGIDGIQLLEQLKRVAPQTVRIMLTGISSQSVAMHAVNKGEIFRFLSKPPDRESLIDALSAAIRQHHLMRAEQELLEDTLRGSVDALAQVLSLSNPRVFGQTTRIRDLMQACARELAVEDSWELETSAMLSQLGCITLTDELIGKVLDNRVLSEQDSAAYARFPLASAELIGKIPRMKTIADNVRYQLKGFDGSGHPVDNVSGDMIPLGARILRVLHDFSRVEACEQSADKALLYLMTNQRCYDPDVIAALTAIVRLKSESVAVQCEEIHLSQMRTEMIIAENIYLRSGGLLLCAGQKVSKTVIDRISSFVASGEINPHFLVTKPVDTLNVR